LTRLARHHQSREQHDECKHRRDDGTPASTTTLPVFLDQLIEPEILRRHFLVRRSIGITRGEQRVSPVDAR
jgi:hypothetical protein